MSRPLTLAIVCLVMALLCPRALADADPASDVLLGENVFYPYSPPVAANLQAALNRETAAAHRAHFPIKVALIDTPVDLGAIPSFFGKPRQYAAFLDQEISFGSRPPLLVVMPDGYGAAGLGPREMAVVDALPRTSGRSSGALAQAAIAAVPKLSAVSGHPIRGQTTGPAATGGGAGPAVALAILGGVCVLLAAGIIAWGRRRASPAAGASRATRTRRR